MHHRVFTAGNQIVLLNSGKDFFPALIADIDAAQEEIFLETYIFSLDETASKVRDALKRAARRGVRVSLVVDWLGSGRNAIDALRRFCVEADIHFRVFNPWCRRGVVRTHRKMCSIDQKFAFVGGINITDDMFSDDERHLPLPAPRWDFAVRVTGPLVENVHTELRRQWRRLGHIGLRERWQKFQTDRAHDKTRLSAPVLAALVIRDNVRNRRTIQRATMQAMGQARHSALLANPYFAPGRRLRRALELAAQRGVAVTLLLGVGHYPLQDAVTQSYYPKLLKAGVRIVEYRRTALHGKVAVIDDHWSTVGSSNYDGFSLLLNQEANVVIKDDDFARVLAADIRAGIEQGVEIELADIGEQPWHLRLWYEVAFLCYRAAMRFITMGNRRQ